MGQRVFLKNINAQKLELRYPKEFIKTKKLHELEYEIRNMSDPQDVRKVNVCRIKPFMAPLLPTSSDASTQMGSPIDSPTMSSDNISNSKNVDVQVALSNLPEEQDGSPGIFLHKRSLAYPPNYVPPRTRAQSRRVETDERASDTVASPLQGDPHAEAILGQNDPDGIQDELNCQTLECDNDSPSTNNEYEALIGNSAKIAGSINSTPEQDTPGEKGSSAKGESSDFFKTSNMHDMRDPSAQMTLICSSTTSSQDINNISHSQGTKVGTSRSLVSAQKTPVREGRPKVTSNEPPKQKYHYFLRTRSSKSNEPYTFLVVDNNK